MKKTNVDNKRRHCFKRFVCKLCIE